MQGKRITLLIVDDQPIVRWGLRGYLEKQGMSVVAETDSPSAAVDLATQHTPDVLLLDPALDESNSLEVTRTISRSSGTKLLGFSASCSRDRTEAFLRAGGSGLVSKNSDPEELLTAIDAITDGRQWISSAASASSPTRASARRKRKPLLSHREREVAVLIARGLPSSQIANRLFVSLNTVETHRYRIFRKLEMHSRAELVEYVLKNNLMEH